MRAYVHVYIDPGLLSHSFVCVVVLQFKPILNTGRARAVDVTATITQVTYHTHTDVDINEAGACHN